MRIFETKRCVGAPREKLNVHEIAPPTFIISAGENCPEYAEFSRVCKAMEKGRSAIGRSISKTPAKPGGPADGDAASAATTEEHAVRSLRAPASVPCSPTRAGKADRAFCAFLRSAAAPRLALPAAV
jgi:hypothetical protein